MLHRHIVKASAGLEIVVGAIFIVAPGFPCALVFGTKPYGIGWPLARWVGVGLFALGIGCLPSKDAESLRSPVLGLLAFNIGIALLLAWVGIVATMHGFLLWPAVVLHSLISIFLLSQLVEPTSRTREKLP